MRFVLASAAAFAVTVVVAACGGGNGGGEGQAESPSDLNLVYSMYTREAAFFRGCEAGVTEKAEQEGVDMRVEISGFDPTRQIQQVENAILQQPDGIIITPIDAEALEPALRGAVDAGIPVIGICDDFGSIEPEAGPERISYIGPDYRLTGVKKAEFIVELLRQRDEAEAGTKIAAYFGVRGVPFDRATREGEEEALNENPEFEYIEGPYSGEYTATGGLESTQNILASDPDIKGLICDNSDQCLGSVTALEEAGIDKDDIIVTSNDAIPPELDAIRNGEIDFTVAWCSFNEGELAVQQFIDLLVDGTPPPEYTLDVGRDITNPDIEAFESENIKSVPIGPDTEPTTRRCRDPVFETTIEEPKTELLQELGLPTG